MAYIGDSQGAAEIDPNAFIKLRSRDSRDTGPFRFIILAYFNHY